MIISAAFIGSVVTSTTGECFTVDDSKAFIATVTWSGNETPSTYGAFCEPCQVSNPCPTPTPTPSISVSRTPSITPSISFSNTPSITPSISISRTPSITPSISISTTPSITPSITPSMTPTPTPTPSISVSRTPSVTPSITPTMTATPSVTITPTMTATPSVTPSTSAPTSGDIVELFYGSSNGAACSEFAPSTFFCLVGSSNLCDATGLLDSDGLVCYGNAAAVSVSEGFGGNVRLWNGTSFPGFCSECLT
jgi:hypothetical protein